MVDVSQQRVAVLVEAWASSKTTVAQLHTACQSCRAVCRPLWKGRLSIDSREVREEVRRIDSWIFEKDISFGY
jgi:hypothetical protein